MGFILKNGIHIDFQFVLIIQKFEIPPDGHRAPVNELLSMNGDQVSPDQLTSYMGNHLLRRLPDNNSSDDVGSLDSSPVRKSTLLADVKFVKPLRNQIFRPTPEGCEKNEKGDSESWWVVQIIIVHRLYIIIVHRL